MPLQLQHKIYRQATVRNIKARLKFPELEQNDSKLFSVKRKNKSKTT